MVVLDPDLGPVLNIVNEGGNVDESTQDGVDATPPPVFNDEDFEQ